MDVQTTINLVGGAILAVIGWFARQLYQSVKDTMREIRNMFEKIFDKLDNKADK